MSSSSSSKYPAKIAGGRFEISKLLGEGCFGAVYRGIDKKTGRQVAVKFEDPSCGAPGSLANELRLLEQLCQPKQQQGFTEVFHFNREAGFTCLVMELLGKSLEDCMESCSGKLPVGSVLLTAEQLLRRIEYLHSKSIIHRDIKPENFLWGVDGKAHHLYMIDLGLSAKYYDRKHIKMREKNSMIGTARYASINVHKGLTQSRRDDLEAVGHMFLYFLRGSLPWSGLKAANEQEKYRKIGEKKETTPLPELCAGFPEEFEAYLHYSRSLPFTERPDYERLQQLFRRAREREGPVSDYDLPWMATQPVDTGRLVALESWTPPRQPDDVEVVEGVRSSCICLGGARSYSAGLPRMIRKDTE